MRTLWLSLTLASTLVLACSASQGPGPTSPPDATPAAAPAEVHTSEYFDGKLSGTVVLRSGVNPPAGSTLKVTITVSNSETDTDLEAASQVVELLTPPPWAFSLALDQATFEPDSSYTVTANITDPAGEIWFGLEDMAKAVFRQAEPHEMMELGMIPMTAAAGG